MFYCFYLIPKPLQTQIVAIQPPGTSTDSWIRKVAPPQPIAPAHRFFGERFMMFMHASGR